MNSFFQFTETAPQEYKLSELAKENQAKSLDYKELDKPISLPFRNSFLPKTDGEWSGEKGNSTWEPNIDKIPEKSNPELLSWGEILKKYGTDGIAFNNGEPDFSKISSGTVEIAGFSDNRDKNFAKADEAEAKIRGWSPEDVEKWRKENHYTWHESKDCKTMDLVPSVIHNNIPHAGGISEIKKENYNNEVR